MITIADQPMAAFISHLFTLWLSSIVSDSCRFEAPFRRNENFFPVAVNLLESTYPALPEELFGGSLPLGIGDSPLGWDPPLDPPERLVSINELLERILGSNTPNNTEPYMFDAWTRDDRSCERSS